ncbi:FMN-dependent NADH-azoreductase [Pedobacter sp. UBA5917]|uniref:FMN-dependent NADH-azoreductase n=1 Tax=Pedobacter sp. UBA5917 TaxID=1947061 RepID=UPI0025E60AB2|nr:NAD(P)H-dependent oxidoreductase [Pedobacter sp. UBA5917]
MKQILHITSSPMGNHSHSIKLGQAIIKKLVDKYPDSKTSERNLINDNPDYINGFHILASLKPDQNRSDEEKDKLHYSDAVIAEIKAADTIVLGAPMYNYSIHASLKAFIDQIVRFGQTIQYQADGSRTGLLKGKMVYLAITAGGSYGNDDFNPVKQYIVNYLSGILNYMGIENIVPVIIEGTAKPDFVVDYNEICCNL